MAAERPRLVRGRFGPGLLVAVLLLFNLGLARPVEAGETRSGSRLVVAVNQLRAEAGLPLLGEHETLGVVAVARSEDMAARGYFSHTTPDGGTVFSLLEDHGVEYTAAGENIAWNSGEGRDAELVALEEFLSSGAHRRILLDPDFSLIGVGIASDGVKRYITVVLTG